MSTALIPEVLDDASTPTARMATLHLVVSPVRSAEGELRMLRQEVPADQTVAAALPPDQPWLRVIWNGRVLDEAEQQTRVLDPGDEVLAIPQWGDPVTWVAVIGLVLSIALSAAQYLLAPPAKPHIQPKLDEPTFSFEGIRTAVGPGGVVPVIYGKHRVGGQLLSSSVDQSLTILDAPVSATPIVPLTIENVTGGTQNDPITIQVTNHGLATGDHVDIGGVTGKTGANGGWYVGVINANEFYLQFSTNTDWNNWTGGGVVVAVPLGVGQRRVDAIATPPTLSMLLALGEGPIGGILFDTIEINGQPIGNFPSVQVITRNGTPDQTPIAEFGEVANTFAPTGVSEIPGDPGIIYTTSAEQEVQAFILNIVFNEGLYFMTAQGEKQENVSTVGYRYRIHPDGPWTDFSYFDVAAARTAPVRFGIRREGVVLARYDIHVQWSHASHVDEGRAGWKPTLESVTEIIHNTEAYPNTALLGLRSVATDSLQGALPNVTVQVLGKIMRVNEFNPVLNWSDNPAPCVMDLLTNSRYGLGIPDSEIDLQGFIAYWFYCEEIINGEKRHTLNYVLDREVRAQPALMEILQGSRTMLIKSDGLWSPRPTRDTLPVQLLSAANVANLKLTYTRDPDRINVMEARFINEEENYESDVLTWPTIANWPSEVRKTSLDIRGVTKPSRITRALQFELNRRRFELLNLEMDCALDAIVLQPHDVFRFSHPLPGWGESGRCHPGSTTGQIVLDAPVVFQGGLNYHVYIRQEDGTVEVKPVQAQPAGEYSILFLTVPLGQNPVPYTSTWAFGEASPVDTAIRLFRVVELAYKSDTTIHLKAIIHNPSIYDEPAGAALPVITDLFNPLGPSPPILSLVLTEVTRVQPDGMSLRVVNLSWDVAALSQGYGPYGGATILRRTVLDSALAGTATAGAVDLGVSQNPTETNSNFAPLTQLRGHILDFDDYSVITGSSYIYRVIPISQRGVPNNTGARDGFIHVSGPTTPDFFPGTVRNLRLKGQAVGVTAWEGRDLHVEWDPVADSPLFTQTFFILDYVVEVWAPHQLYRLRQTAVPAGSPGQTLTWTYTFAENLTDELQAGHTHARRDVEIWVWARSNTGRVSLDPAHIAVTNPPPDMSMIMPEVDILAEGASISWDQWVEPHDLDHYEAHLDTIDPPLTIYADVATFFNSVGTSVRKINALKLTAGVTYYFYVLPYDTFGPGLPSVTISFVPFSFSGEFLDSVPPATPTGLTLTTGTSVSDDGTIVPWIQANWNIGTEADLAGYEVQFRIPTISGGVSDFQVGRVNHARLESVPGNVTIFCRVAAFDQLQNISPFTAEVSMTTASDTVPPAAPTNLIATADVEKIHLLWTPPSDADYAISQVWSSTTNNLTTATEIGRGAWSFEHNGLGLFETRYYWVRAMDSSGNLSANYYPVGPTSTVTATAGQLTSTFIESLVADKITAGTLDALVYLGVANRIRLDGVNQNIIIQDNQTPSPVTRVQLGRLGALSNEWGLQLFGAGGQLMWNFTDGAQTPGIASRAITTGKIAVGAITAELLIADTAVITQTAQIANAVITSAQIAELQADKIFAGNFNYVYTVGGTGGGANTFIIIDGPNKRIQVLDNQSPQAVRTELGQVGPGALDFGLKIYNPAGDTMWELTSGASTFGIQDLAVTNAKIANATITTAKINDLSADKITAGTLTAVYRIGVGDAIILDGFNRFIEVIDENGVVRVQLGHISAGTTNYGLRIWNSAAQLMYDFTDGARTAGIAPGAVSGSVSLRAVSSMTTTGAEIIAQTLTFPEVTTGDVLLFWVSGQADAVSTSTIRLRLHPDIITGTVISETVQDLPANAENIALTGYFVVTGGTFTNRQFHLTIERATGTGSVTLSQVIFTGLRLQR